jgi:hypothetical protein
MDVVDGGDGRSHLSSRQHILMNMWVCRHITLFAGLWAPLVHRLQPWHGCPALRVLSGVTLGLCSVSPDHTRT